jgi:hypothetical protein
MLGLWVLIEDLLSIFPQYLPPMKKTTSFVIFEKQPNLLEPVFYQENQFQLLQQ